MHFTGYFSYFSCFHRNFFLNLPLHNLHTQILNISIISCRDFKKKNVENRPKIRFFEFHSSFSNSQCEKSIHASNWCMNIEHILNFLEKILIFSLKTLNYINFFPAKANETNASSPNFNAQLMRKTYLKSPPINQNVTTPQDFKLFLHLSNMSFLIDG
jgi:hypothetical protein